MLRLAILPTLLVSLIGFEVPHLDCGSEAVQSRAKELFLERLHQRGHNIRIGFTGVPDNFVDEDFFPDKEYIDVTSDEFVSGLRIEFTGAMTKYTDESTNKTYCLTDVVVSI